MLRKLQLEWCRDRENVTWGSRRRKWVGPSWSPSEEHRDQKLHKD